MRIDIELSREYSRSSLLQIGAAAELHGDWIRRMSDGRFDELANPYDDLAAAVRRVLKLQVEAEEEEVVAQ